MSTVIQLVGGRDLPRGRRASASKMDTILLSPAVVKAWKTPPFQRPLRVNDKVRAVAEELKHNAGVIPGVITLGELDGQTYIIDGQHRIEAFLQSGLKEGISDVRICSFDDLGQMGEEFVQLNSSIVRMRPDDVLRGLENTLAPMKDLRKRCPFIGYDQIRRGNSSPMLSMSTALRCWFGSATEVPTTGGVTATALARGLTDDETRAMANFFNCMHTAWGGDPEYFRLWSTLNVTVVAWLWRRSVVTAYSQKSVRLTAAQFTECAMGLSADTHYLSWLVGRMLTDRDRSPCYAPDEGHLRAADKGTDDQAAAVPSAAMGLAWREEQMSEAQRDVDDVDVDVIKDELTIPSYPGLQIFCNKGGGVTLRQDDDRLGEAIVTLRMVDLPRVIAALEKISASHHGDIG